MKKFINIEKHNITKKMINSKPKNRYQNNYSIGTFTDYLNLEFGVSDYCSGYHFDYTIIDMYLGSMGSIKISKAYAPWSKFRVAAEKISHFKVELIEAHEKKDNMDVQMAVDMIDTLYRHPEINLYVVISGDIDFAYAIRKIKQNRDVKVLLISEENSLNQKYHRIVDKVVSYQRLMRLYWM
ncbi:hypothetical protein LCGC14_1334530 [marine sediment metagenome]|uniref:NYN domain-containing protein n=1 Tax=marine sediment metagenome TaxID=412755 RepID=A0A0F9KFG4_9ZZZZ